MNLGPIAVNTCSSKFRDQLLNIQIWFQGQNIKKCWGLRHMNLPFRKKLRYKWTFKDNNKIIK